ncbi:MAG: pyridoxamine 5'-phosphate oxidase family protein [Rudaea sp.]
MAKIFPEITDKLRAWIEEQKMFFVGSAPLAADGFVNCSPKGLDSFRILGDHEAAYLDMIGSGIETVADLRENGRIVIMFCSFDRVPRIVRLHGKGTVYEKGTAEFAEYEKLFPHFEGERAIIHIDVTRVSDSCGYGVPIYEYVGQRDTMAKWVQAQGDQGLRDFVVEQNTSSINGLPGLAGVQKS